MKRTLLLNRHVSRLVASLGHLDEIVLADAGLPISARVEVIDLAFMPRVPDPWSVLEALRSELIIEGAFIADEAESAVSDKFKAHLEEWSQETGASIAITRLRHTDFKDRTKLAKAVIRTGECTPYCNIGLVSGVPF